MAVQKLQINLQELADLQAVVSYYEKNVSSQQGGRTAIAASWRPLEQMRANFSSSYKSLEPSQAIKRAWGDVKKGAETVNQGYNEGVTNKVNEALASLTSAADGATRDATVEVGPFRIQSRNTINAVAQAKTPGEAAAVLLKDCLPCDMRLEAVQLIPDLSFLDELIEMAAKWIDMMGGIAETILGSSAGGDDVSVNLCITLNMMNFTCLPDMSALVAMLSKSLALNVTIPSFTISPISSLSAMIVTPILATIVNLVQAWMNLILKPVDCVLDSLSKLIKKFEFKGGEIGKKFKAGVGVSGGKITYGKKVIAKGVNVNKSTGLPDGAKKFFGNLDNSKKIEAMLKSLQQFKAFIEKHKKKIIAHFDKVRGKYRSSLNELTRFVQSVVASAQEIMKITNLITLVYVVKDLFANFSGQCSSKEEAIEAVKQVAPAAAAANIPGLHIVRQEGGNVATAKKVDITGAEAEALGLKDKDGVILLDPSNVPLPDAARQNLSGYEGTVQVQVHDTISLADCVSDVATRAEFYDVSPLI